MYSSLEVLQAPLHAYTVVGQPLSPRLLLLHRMAALDTIFMLMCVQTTKRLTL